MRKASTIKSNVTTSQKPPSINSTKIEINKVSNQYNQIKSNKRLSRTFRRFNS